MTIAPDVLESPTQSIRESEYCRSFDSQTSRDAPRPQPPRSVLERVTVILGSFADKRERLTLQDLVQRTNLPRSTTHRILDSLVHLDWLEHSGNSYQLAHRALRFGGHGSDHIRLRSTANPHLLGLHVRTGMTVALSSIEGSDVVVRDLIGVYRPTSLQCNVGDSGPAFQTVAGRAMLAAMTPEAVDEIVRSQLPSRVGNAMWTRPKLHRELHRIRQSHGVSIDRNGHSSAHPGVAYALCDDYGVTAAVSLHPPTRQQMPDWPVPLLVNYAQQINNHLRQ